MLYDDGFLHAHAEIEVALSLGKNSRQAWVTLPDSQPASAYDWLLRLAETRNQQDPSTYTVSTNGSQVIVTLGTAITLPANFYLSGYFISSNTLRMCKLPLLMTSIRSLQIAAFLR
jgi:hypothetical protein